MSIQTYTSRAGYMHAAQNLGDELSDHADNLATLLKDIASDRVNYPVAPLEAINELLIAQRQLEKAVSRIVAAAIMLENPDA